MKKIFAITAALIMLSVATQGLAQQAATALPVANPTPRALQLSHQYLDLLQMPQRMDTMMSSMVPQMLNSMSQSTGGQVNPALRDIMTTAARESTATAMPDMMERMAQLYARVLTEEELDALVTFYSSPAGRSVLNKTAQTQAVVNEAMSDMSPRLSADMFYRLCKATKCPAELSAQGHPWKE